VGWIVLGLAGLSYWFWLGFPFANHNESYAWIAQFRSMDLGDALTHHLIGVANVRPLGTGGAWLAYRASHGSIAPVELFNYLLAVVAWAALALHQANRRVFALAALGVGGVLFSGYVYLFHLHGIFYSPLLALLALLLSQDERPISRGRLGALFLASLVTALFHPFALPVFAAWTFGQWLERRLPLASTAAAIVASATLTRFLLTGAKSLPFGPETWSGLAVSYRMVEIHPAVTVFALVLIAGTALTTRIPARPLYAATLVTAAIALAGATGSALPVWIVACLVKLALERRWSWAGMLALAAIFPIAYPTGSPTYTVPAWMIAAATLALGATRLEGALARLPRILPWTAAGLIACAWLAVRQGDQVPVLTRLAEPLIAERERTHQLEYVLDWALLSSRREDPVVLYREARSPSEAANAIDRIHRPPTQQAHLDRYLAEMRPGAGTGSSRLLVTFGGEPVPGAELIFRMRGAHAGEIRVYERTAAYRGTHPGSGP
jgi:hypothetical protein